MTKEIATLASTLPTVPMALALAVIQDVAGGETVHQACKSRALSVAAFRACMKKEPELQAMLTEALDVCNDVLNDMLINIDQTHSDAKMASVISKNIQWVLERNNPARFAGRLTLTTDNEVSRNLAEALNKAMDRLPPPPTSALPTVTDVTFEVVEKVAAPLGAAPRGLGEEATGVSETSLDELRRLGFL